jgi:hypothetical protein
VAKVHQVEHATMIPDLSSGISRLFAMSKVREWPVPMMVETWRIMQVNVTSYQDNVGNLLGSQDSDLFSFSLFCLFCLVYTNVVDVVCSEGNRLQVGGTSSAEQQAALCDGKWNHQHAFHAGKLPWASADGLHPVSRSALQETA